MKSTPSTFLFVSCCNPFVQTSAYHLCEDLLMEYGFQYAVQVDTAAAMKLSGGRINPDNGFVILCKDNELVGFDIFYLCRYLEHKGWIPC